MTQRRSTSQRAVILDALETTSEFQSAQELHSALRAKGSSIGLATVYRALQDLVSVGDLDTVRNASGETLYRQCAQPAHHHHLVCRSCGRTQEVSAPSVERWAQALAEEYGYVDVDHQLEIFGVCAPCAAQGAAAPNPPPP